MGGEVGLRERQRLRELEDSAVSNRSTSRPTLPVEMWEQRRHLSSQFGYFAQAAEVDGVRTARRLGTNRHLPDESDGIPVAGKSRHRFERNQIRMLEGTLAREGEA